MERLKHLITIILLLGGLVHANAQDTEECILSYSDNFAESGSDTIHIPMVDKTDRNDEFRIETSNAKYQIQSTPYSQANPPFSFVTDSRSLMTSNLHSGNYILGIDGITKDVLEYIGWGLFSEDDVWISSTDVPSTGIASAYSNHHFTVNSNVTDFTNPRWELSAEMSDGSVSTIELPDEGMACTVNAIDNESAYKIRLDGDIRMSLTFNTI